MKMRIKLSNLLAKYGSCALALALTALVTEVASRGCLYIQYQPEEPKNLKKFSRNK